MGFLGELVGVVRVLQRPFGMPFSGIGIAFFVVLGGGAVRVSSQFVLLRGLAV